MSKKPAIRLPEDEYYDDPSPLADFPIGVLCLGIVIVMCIVVCAIFLCLAGGEP